MSKLLTSLTLPEQASPGTPATGFVSVFGKGDGLYYKNSAGTEFKLGLYSTNGVTTDTTQTVTGSKTFQNTSTVPAAVTSPGNEGAFVGMGRNATTNHYIGEEGTLSYTFNDAVDGDLVLLSGLNSQSIRIGHWNPSKGVQKSSFVINNSTVTSNLPLYENTARVYSDANPFFKDINDYALRRFREAINRVDLEPADILFLGESMVEGVGATTDTYRFQSQIRTALQNRYNPVGVTGGEGYIPGRHTGSTPSQRWTYGGGYSHYTGQEIWGIGRRGVRLDAAGEYAEIVVTTDQFWLLYTTGVDAGMHTISIDGTVVATIDAYTASPGYGSGKWDSGPLTPGTHTVRMTAVAGTARPVPTVLSVVEGIMVFNGDGGTAPDTGKGVRTWDGARGGYRAADFDGLSTNTSYWIAPLHAQVAPDLVVIEFAGNEYLQQNTPASFETSLNALIDRVRLEVSTDPSFLLVGIHQITSFTFPNGTGTPDYPWSQYLDVLKRVALAKGCAFIDMQDRIEPAALSAGSDLYYENIHANNYGHRLYGEEYVYVLTGSRLPSGGFARQDQSPNFVPSANSANTAVRFGYSGSLMSYNGGTLMFDNTVTLDGGTTYKAVTNATLSGVVGTQGGNLVFYTAPQVAVGAVQTYTKRLQIGTALADFTNLEIKTTGVSRANNYNAPVGGKTSIQMNQDTGGVVFQTNASANKGLIVKGFTGQTANLFEAQDPTATSVWVSINQAGSLAALQSAYVGGVSGSVGSGWRAALRVLISSNADPGMQIRSASNQTGDTFQIQDSTGANVTRVLPTGAIWTQGVVFTSGASYFNASVNVQPDTASTSGMVIRSLANQTGDLIQLQNSAGTIVGAWNPSGAIWTTGVYDNGNRVYSASNPPPAGGVDLSNYVTLTGTQTVTGTKTFNSLLVNRGTENLAPVITGNAAPVKMTVSPTAAPPAAPAVNDIWIVSDANPGGTAGSGNGSSIKEIDYVERGYSFDFLAAGSTYQDIEGMRITVPPQTVPYYIEFGGIVNSTSGTAVAGSALIAYIALNDVTNNKLYGYTSSTGYVSNITTQQSVHLSRRIAPHAETRVYQISGRVSSPIPTGWSTMGLLATDAPTSGLWPPAYLKAVSI